MSLSLSKKFPTTSASIDCSDRLVHEDTTKPDKHKTLTPTRDGSWFQS